MFNWHYTKPLVGGHVIFMVIHYIPYYSLKYYPVLVLKSYFINVLTLHVNIWRRFPRIKLLKKSTKHTLTLHTLSLMYPTIGETIPNTPGAIANSKPICGVDI